MFRGNLLFAVVLLSVVGTCYAGEIFVETPLTKRTPDPWGRPTLYMTSNYTAVLEPEDESTPFCASYGFPADCSVASGHEHPVKLWYYNAGETPGHSLHVTSSETVASVIRYFQGWGTVSSSHTLSEGNIRECLGFSVGPGTIIPGPNPNVAFQGGEWVPFKGKGCAEIPDTAIRSCSIINGSVTLDHGVLSPSEFEGKQTSMEVQVSCNDSASGTFSAPEDGRVRLDSTTYASLSINGVGLSQEVQMPLKWGVNTVALTSTLHGKPTGAGGTLTGNTVLVFNYW